MKGSVYNGFESYVTETYGLGVWQKSLEFCSFENKGVYLASETYDDRELVSLIAAVSSFTPKTSAEIQRDFGQYFFKTLFSLIAVHVKHIDNLFDFLRAVDDVIHVEVKKADPLAYTPSFFYDQPQSNVLVMRYMSSRKMCFFAEGLIAGAAEYYQEVPEIEQLKCVHCGDDYCLINIKI